METVVELKALDIVVDYHLTKDEGDRDTPPHTEVEIYNVYHKGVDVTQLLENLGCIGMIEEEVLNQIS